MIPAIRGSQKTRDRALAPAAQGLSCARAGQWMCGVKSAIGKQRTPLPEPELLSGAALELDGLGTRTPPGVGN